MALVLALLLEHASLAWVGSTLSHHSLAGVPLKQHLMALILALLLEHALLPWVGSNRT
jgi:hypothetical protein